MINALLKAKHWVLFTIVIGIPFIANMVFTSSIMAAGFQSVQPDPEDILKSFSSMGVILPVLMILPNLVNFGWYYAVLEGLKERIPAEAKIPMKTVKGFLIFCLFYLVILAVLMGWLFSYLGSGFRPDESLVLIILAVIPFHLFFAFCMIYSWVYVGKAIKCAESGKNEKFYDYASDFILCWFWFVGIWLLQPRIQRMLEEGNGSFEQDDEIS